MSLNFSKKSLVFITGASKGIGRTIAIELSRNFNSQQSIFILIARSNEGLEETKNFFLELDKSLFVLTFQLDLSKPDLKIYEDLFDQIISSIDTLNIDYGLIFHNAGSVGDLKQTTNLSNLEDWRNYYDFNLFSTVLLNSVFIKRIRPIVQQLIVVNITSLIGRKPFENFAMYGTGKAARELFFKILALEESNISVLNYSPGAVDTDMLSGIVNNAQDVQVRENFQKFQQTALTTEQTVGKLLSILEKGEYRSGDTIDYYDE